MVGFMLWNPLHVTTVDQPEPEPGLAQNLLVVTLTPGSEYLEYNLHHFKNNA